MARRVAIVLLSAVLAVGLLGAAQQEKTRIEVWVWGDLTAQFMETLEATFNTAYPTYELDIVGKKATEYNTILTTALQGGAGPAAFLTRINPMPAQFAQAGLVEAVDVLVPLIGFYDQAALAALSSGGKPYAVPYAVVAYPIYYNVDIFVQHGLSIPTTWEEFISLCQALQAAGVAPISMYHANWAYTEIVHPTVAAAFLPDAWLEALEAGEVTYDSPEFVRTFEALAQLVPYLIDGWEGMTYGDARAAFAGGEAAMIFDGNWSVPTFRDLNPDLNFDVFVLPPPADLGQGLRMYWRLDGGWSVNAVLGAVEREVAIAFLNFVAGPLANEILARDLGILPVAPGVRLALADPLSRKISELRVAHGVEIMYGIGGQVALEYGGFYGALGTATEGVFLGALTPEQAAAQVEASK
jgi:raffinose/stachyose/melibiose transport system substrate-binding protein